MNEEDSVDDFLEAVEVLFDSRKNEETEKEIINAPQLDTTIFSNFRLLMKSSPRNRDGSKSPECKKCDLTKKRLEEKIEKLEATLLFQQEQLFEAYSYLKARVTILEEREQKRLRVHHGSS